MKTQNINNTHSLLRDIIQEFKKSTITLQRSRLLELLSLTQENGKKYICPLENSGIHDAHIYEYEDGVFGIFINPETDEEIFEYSKFESVEHAQTFYNKRVKKLTALNKSCFDTIGNVSASF